MKCPKCGKEIADDSQFCESCGARVAINGDEPKKKTNWWGILGGAGVMIAGIIIWSHSIGNSKQQVDVTQSGSVYYGTYIGEQYIYMMDCVMQSKRIIIGTPQNINRSKEIMR